MIVYLSVCIIEKQDKAPAMLRLNILKTELDWVEPVTSIVLRFDASDATRLTWESIKTVDTMIKSSDLLCWMSYDQYDCFRAATNKRLKIDISKNSVVLPESFTLPGNDSTNLHEALDTLRDMGVTSPSKLRNFCANVGEFQ